MPVELYKIVLPRLRIEPVYFFTTDQGIEYEVRFGREADNYSNAIVAFGVINEEYDNEYVETNKGEIFRVINTVIKIVDLYIDEHPLVNSIRFTAQSGEGEDEKNISKRLKFYKRYISLFERKGWKFQIDGNHVLMQK